jgi:hypothetical protein
MTEEDLYHDYKLLLKMKVGNAKKVRLLSDLLGEAENPWRVVGITHEALKVFKNHGFKKVSKMGINRSHITRRKETYSFMLKNNFDNAKEWWNYHFENDITILSTSSENLSGKSSKIIDIDPSLNLFKCRGFGWTHGKKEILFLEKLHSEKSKNS